MMMQTVTAALEVNAVEGAVVVNLTVNRLCLWVTGMPNLLECPPTPIVPVNLPDRMSTNLSAYCTSTRPPGSLAPPNARHPTPEPHHQELLVQLWIPHFCRHYLRTSRPLHKPECRFPSQCCPWEGIISSRLLVSLTYLKQLFCCSTYLFGQESKNSAHQ